MSKPLTKHALLRASHVVLPPASQFCNYAPRVCMKTRVAGYDFCIRHILEDKNSPYKQCTYVSGKTNHRCTAAVPRIEKRDGLAVYVVSLWIGESRWHSRHCIEIAWHLTDLIITEVRYLIPCDVINPFAL